MLNRLLLAWAVLTLVAFCAGCGSVRPQANLVDDGQFVELVWYTNGVAPKDADLVLAKANAYLKDKLNCALKVQFVPLSYDTKVTTLISAGEQLDIVNSYRHANIDQAPVFDFREKAPVGYLLDLDALIRDNAPQITKLFDATELAGARIKHAQYAIPCLAGSASQTIWSYDASIARSYAGRRFDYSKTLSLFADLHAQRPEVLCIANPLDSALADYDFVVDMWMPGALAMSDHALRMVNQFDSPDFVRALRFATQCNTRGYSPTSKDALSGGTIYSRFVERSYLDMFSESHTDALAAGDTRLYMRDVDSVAIALPVNCAYPARAVKLIELLYRDAYLKNLLTFGIEGQHYRRSPDGRISWLDAHIDYLVDERTFGNARIDYVPAGQPVDKWQKVRARDAGAIKSPLAGFVLDMQQLKSWSPVFLSIIGAHKDNLLYGRVDVTQELTKLNAELRANGLEEYPKALQRQVDEWQHGN